jgi:hypothetical protein
MISFYRSGEIVIAREFVLIGGTNSGKTHYAGQLYGRLRRAEGCLLLRKEKGTPPDLSPLENVLKSLASGHAAEHTPSSTWAEIALPLVSQTGESFDLRWPDYGGEQIGKAFEERAISEAWRERLQKATGWIVLIRLQSETTYQDALDRLRQPRDEAEIPARLKQWDANARWVEMFQILLHVAGHGTVEQRRFPKLAILLSCYDELEAGDLKPPEVLAKRLPLMSAFVDSVWSSNSVSVWGLSALGCALEPDSENTAFIDEGPETQGWIVEPSGKKSSDLTKPLAWLLQAQEAE